MRKPFFGAAGRFLIRRLQLSAGWFRLGTIRMFFEALDRGRLCLILPARRIPDGLQFIQDKLASHAGSEPTTRRNARFRAALWRVQRLAHQYRRRERPTRKMSCRLACYVRQPTKAWIFIAEHDRPRRRGGGTHQGADACGPAPRPSRSWRPIASPKSTCLVATAERRELARRVLPSSQRPRRPKRCAPHVPASAWRRQTCPGSQS